jgi:hypothetical protein
LAGQNAVNFRDTPGRTPAHATVALQKHQLHSHSIDFLPEFTKPADRRVKIGREILKELARRADAGADPLKDMDGFIHRTIVRLG